MTQWQAFLVVIIAAAVTLFTRALPFWVFSADRVTPKVVVYLGRVLPSAIIAMLIVYCLKGINFFAGSHGVPELIAVAAVIWAHRWKHNLILSIGGGTVLYMLLIQYVFV